MALSSPATSPARPIRLVADPARSLRLLVGVGRFELPASCSQSAPRSVREGSAGYAFPLFNSCFRGVGRVARSSPLACDFDPHHPRDHPRPTVAQRRRRSVARSRSTVRRSAWTFSAMASMVSPSARSEATLRRRSAMSLASDGPAGRPRIGRNSERSTPPEGGSVPKRSRQS